MAHHPRHPASRSCACIFFHNSLSSEAPTFLSSKSTDIPLATAAIAAAAQPTAAAAAALAAATVATASIATRSPRVQLRKLQVRQRDLLAMWADCRLQQPPEFRASADVRRSLSGFGWEAA